MAWQAVEEDPESLPARQVLADSLLELHDPLGELIALHVHGETGLREQHLRREVGGPLIGDGGQWRWGLLREWREPLSADDLARFAQLPVSRVLEHIVLPTPSAEHRRVVEQAPFRRSLTTITCLVEGFEPGMRRMRFRLEVFERLRFVVLRSANALQHVWSAHLDLHESRFELAGLVTPERLGDALQWPSLIRAVRLRFDFTLHAAGWAVLKMHRALLKHVEQIELFSDEDLEAVSALLPKVKVSLIR